MHGGFDLAQNSFQVRRCFQFGPQGCELRVDFVGNGRFIGLHDAHRYFFLSFDPKTEFLDLGQKVNDRLFEAVGVRGQLRQDFLLPFQKE